MVDLILFVLGLACGSFVNALVWRLHEQAKLRLNQKKKLAKLSISQGRSMCPHCEHKLAWYDLIPIVSWLLLRAKCRYCHKSISSQYPLVEVVTAVTFVLSFIYWPYPFNNQGVFSLIVWLIILTGLIALLVYDLKWMLLPNRLIFPLIELQAFYLLIRLCLFSGRMDLLFHLFWGLVLGGGLFYLLFHFSRGKWIGGGDVKLGALLGLIVGGPWSILLVIFLSSLLGTIITIPLILLRRINLSRRIPFGPLLIISVFIVQLFGLSIIAWYKRHFLFLPS